MQFFSMTSLQSKETAICDLLLSVKTCLELKQAVGAGNMKIRIGWNIAEELRWSWSIGHQSEEFQWKKAWVTRKRKNNLNIPLSYMLHILHTRKFWKYFSNNKIFLWKIFYKFYLTELINTYGIYVTSAYTYYVKTKALASFLRCIHCNWVFNKNALPKKLKFRNLSSSF